MRRIATNFFISFHLLVLCLWCLPPLKMKGNLEISPENPYLVYLRERLCDGTCAKVFSPAFRYITWVGLSQAWEMFAPDPVMLAENGNAITLHAEADVIFRDGSVKTWTWPHPEQHSFPDRYRLVRHVTWMFNLLSPDFAALRPDGARYIARLFASDPANPPVEVKFWTLAYEIAPPLPQDYQPRPVNVAWQRLDSFYTYQVQPGDLQ